MLSFKALQEFLARIGQRMGGMGVELSRDVRKKDKSLT